MRKAVGVVLVIWLLSAAQAVSAHLSIEARPGEVMVGDTLTVDCYSSEPMNSTMEWHITSPISNSWEMTQINETHYQHAKEITSFFEPDTYTIHCSNGSMSSPDNSFVVYEIGTDITECGDSAYSDQMLEIRVQVTKNTGTTQYLGDGVIFRVFLDNTELELADNPFYYPSENEWLLVTKNLSSFAPGDYILRVEAEYNGRVFSDAKPFTVRPEYEFYIDSVSPSEINGGETVSVGLVAEHHGAPILNESELDVLFNGEDIGFEKTGDGFVFTAPELGSGTYELFVGMDYNGVSLNDTEDIRYMIHISGELIDANGKAVSGSIKFTRDAYQKTITTNSDGSYTGNIPSGTYKITATLPGVKVTVFNAAITGTWDNAMRFDLFTGQNLLEGLQEGMAFALELPVDFDDVSFEAGYDPKRISDESGLKVYACDEWNLEARRCEGEWERISADVDTSANKVNFMVSHLSAFVAGNSRPLFIDAKTDRDRYFVGERIEVSGYVRNKNGGVIPDADIEVRAGSVSEKGKTNHNGVFSLQIEAPDEEGNHTVLVTASKGLYEAATQSIGVSVEKQKGITVTVPVSASISVNASSSMEISVFNSGQDTLRDLEVSITGLPEGTFSYEPEVIRKLDPGEEEKVLLRVSLPASSKKSYVVGIGIKGEGVEKDENFVVSVSGQLGENASQEGVSSEGSGSGTGMDFISAFLFLDASGMVNVASVIASVAILVILLFKMKGKTRTTRTYVSNLIGSVKQEVSRGSYAKRTSAEKKKR